jgi:hypothetical protein
VQLACLEVFSTSYVRLRCNGSDHRLSTVSWNALKVAKQMRGASLGSQHLTDTQIHYRKGAFFAVVDNMTNLIDQTNNLMYSAIKHITMRSSNESMAVIM